MCKWKTRRERPACILAVLALELTVCEKPYITLTCASLEVSSPSSGVESLKGFFVCLLLT